MNSKINVLLTCASGPGGVSAVKSLKDHTRYRLFGVDSDPLSLGLYSKYLVDRYCVPPGDSSDYLTHIEEIVKKDDINIIFPMSDEEVTSLSQQKKQFEAMGVVIPIADYDVVSKADDKLVTIRIAEMSGIPVPRTIEFRNLDSLDFKKLTYPALIKPIYERGGKGIEFVYNEDKLIEAYQKLSPRYGTRLMIQEVIPGGRGSIHLFAGLYDRSGILKASFMSRSIRTKYEFGGPGEGGEPIVDEDLRKQSLTLLNAVGRWFGPVNVEFKRSSMTGKLMLLEINARYWGYSYLATAAGINFPLLTMKVAMGEEFPDQHDYRTDIITLKSTEHCVVNKRDLLRPIDF